MSRRRTVSGESLDLLLDTICNTFGGVVFIALLVVLLLRLSPATGGQAGSQAAVLSGIVSEWERVLGDRYESLLASELASVSADDASAEELVESIEALQELMQVEFEVKKQLGDALVGMIEGEERLATKKQQRKRLQSERMRVEKEHEEAVAVLTVLKGEVVELQQRHEDLKEAVTQAAVLDRQLELPVERQDANSQVSIFLKYGRIYFPFDDFGVNQDEFSIERGWFFNVAKPKPYQGIPVDVNGAASNEITQRLARFPPAECFVHLIVCEDSFEYFQSVKAQLASLGYRYHLTPLRSGGSLWQSDSGPTSSQ